MSTTIESTPLHPFPKESELKSASSTLRLACGALLFLIGGFGFWSMAAKISGAIIAQGYIAVESGQHKVQHADGGTLSDLFVRNGDVVENGDVLAHIEGTHLISERTSLSSQVLELEARAYRLFAEKSELDTFLSPTELLSFSEKGAKNRRIFSRQREIFTTRQEVRDQQINTINERKAQLEIQVEGLLKQADALREQISLLSEEIEDQKSLLAAKLTRKSGLFALSRNRAELRGRLAEVNAFIAERRAQIAELKLQVVGVGIEYRERATKELAEVSTLLRNAREDLHYINSQIAQLEITAPVSGTIHNMQITTSQTVLRAAEPLLYIVPLDQPAVVRARIDAMQRDKIHLGQDATIKFSAFDRTGTPELKGKLTMVSADALSDDRRGARYFDVQITIPVEEIKKLPDGNVLLPGVPAEAYIQTGSYSPMAYLTKPLFDYFAKAFRES